VFFAIGFMVEAVADIQKVRNFWCSWQ
jgi:hypothetical protein